MVQSRPWERPGKWELQTPLGLQYTNRPSHGARRPDLVLVDKSKKSCRIIDLAIPEDSGVKEKEAEKVEKHQNLARELRRMWEVKTKTKVVPIVLGALGTILLRLNGNLIWKAKGYNAFYEKILIALKQNRSEFAKFDSRVGTPVIPRHARWQAVSTENDWVWESKWHKCNKLIH